MLNKLSKRQLAIIGLTVATAVIHFSLLFPDVLFILNGLGYLGLMAALYFIPQFIPYRKWVRWAFIGFTALTVILYFLMNGSDAFSNPLGLITKAIEIALIVLLFMES